LDWRQLVSAANSLGHLAIESISYLFNRNHVAAGGLDDQGVSNLPECLKILSSRRYLHSKGITEGLVSLLTARIGHLNG